MPGLGEIWSCVHIAATMIPAIPTDVEALITVNQSSYNETCFGHNRETKTKITCASMQSNLRLLRVKIKCIIALSPRKM